MWFQAMQSLLFMQLLHVSEDTCILLELLIVLTFIFYIEYSLWLRLQICQFHSSNFQSNVWIINLKPEEAT